MWRLMIADAFHWNSESLSMSLYYILYFNLFFNMINRSSNIGCIAIFLFFVFLSLSLLFFPIRLAKGLYLCPLTETDRINYLKKTCFFRFFAYEFLLILILLILRYTYHLQYVQLLLFFLCSTGMILDLLFLAGFYNPLSAKKLYYTANKLPVPEVLKSMEETNRTPLTGTILLILTLILCCIGITLPFNNQHFDYRWLYYYVPALLLSAICLILYFIKFFPVFITINANHEVYSYRKKAGVFHAD